MSHPRRSAFLLIALLGVAGLAGCGGGGGDCRGLTGRASSPNMLVLLSRVGAGNSEQVVTEVRSDVNSRFEFEDLPDGTYVVRTLRTTPDFAGQQPFYNGLYVDSEVEADVPGICGPLGATDTNEETR